MWELRRKTAKLIDRTLDLVVRLSALGRVQFHRRAAETTIGPPRNRCHYFQITTQFHHDRRGRLHCMLPLRLQKQLRLIQKPIANRRCCSPPGCIQLSRFSATQPATGKPLGHAPAVVRTGPRHRHQQLHRYVRRDRAIAHLLLNTAGKQLHQTHPTRHPTRAAIKTPGQYLQPIAEALFQFHQKPAFFQRRLVIARTHRPVQKQSLHFTQRPDHRFHRVPAQLLERRDPLIAVDHQITISMFGRDHDDRRLLTAGRQRRQQSPLPPRTTHAKVLQAPLKLMEFQPHHTHPLHSSTLHQLRSGIARQDRVVSPHPPWNQ